MNFIDSVLREHYDEWGLAAFGLGPQWDTVMITPQFTTSRHVVGLIFAGGTRRPALVVKVPRCPGDNEGVQREAEMLRQLTALSGGRVEGIPHTVATLERGKHTVLVETALTGIPLDPQRVAGDLAGAVALGVDFVAGLPCTRPGPDNGDWYGRTVERPLEALASLLPGDAEVSALVRRTHELLGPLRDSTLPAVFEHADLSHPNLLVQAGGGLQVMDWERSSLYGVPAHDLVFYLQYLSESSDMAFSRVAQLAAFDKAFGPGGWALAPLREHLVFRDIDPGLLPLLVIAAWARSTATLSFRLASEDVPAPGSAQLRAAILDDRDFWLWRHVVTSY
ncbi:aminoglycoside phosphotransferase family protein [Arthrobacter sp. PsM3]|uniref:aminoglycoside phosphotransferase family protein n=1 Tax=Arthrobacter sp. PsM3 TaxID=3030531 RepID=UPI00263B0767|nr:aminoglycoside phosphotransferase family protein [Arthrobacter sp. PsM3]MDN4643032.1 aminoglycoside phosphotransferase family protein [Arthrobacter sp. PsM3]